MVQNIVIASLLMVGGTFTAESRLKGQVSAASYKMYIKYAGGNS